VEGLTRGVDAGARGFCTACFTGTYPTSIPLQMLKNIEAERKMSSRVKTCSQ
jgi:glutamine phosphoribosylpyrophosphate amidotransferase